MRLSLNHPVRLFVDSNMDVADNLRQEFVRIKAKKEGDREAIITGECKLCNCTTQMRSWCCTLCAYYGY